LKIKINLPIIDLRDMTKWTIIQIKKKTKLKSTNNTVKLIQEDELIKHYAHDDGLWNIGLTKIQGHKTFEAWRKAAKYVGTHESENLQLNNAIGFWDMLESKCK